MMMMKGAMEPEVGLAETKAMEVMLQLHSPGIGTMLHLVLGRVTMLALTMQPSIILDHYFRTQIPQETLMHL